MLSDSGRIYLRSYRSRSVHVGLDRPSDYFSAEYSSVRSAVDRAVFLPAPRTPAKTSRSVRDVGSLPARPFGRRLLHRVFARRPAPAAVRIHKNTNRVISRPPVASRKPSEGIFLRQTTRRSSARPGVTNYVLLIDTIMNEERCSTSFADTVPAL